MAIYKFKNIGRAIVKPLVKILSHIHPNVITWVSLFSSGIAGWCCYKSEMRWALVLVPIFILLRMGCNLLDGMVARERNLASSKGEALQEAIDRFADVFIVLGITFSVYGNIKLGIFVISIMLISSYLGILKKAVGGKREFGGILGKVDRLFFIIIFSIIQYFWKGQLLGLNIFEILLILFIIGGLVTIVQRALSIKRI